LLLVPRSRSQCLEMIQPTPRQLQILRRVAEGDTLRQIALDLGLANGTVKNQMLKMRRRIGAKSSENAVAIALREGWIK